MARPKGLTNSVTIKVTAADLEVFQQLSRKLKKSRSFLLRQAWNDFVNRQSEVS